LSLEAKGRANTPNARSLNVAKRQARALRTVNGRDVVAHIVCWTLSRKGALEARLHDPKRRQEKPIDIQIDYNELLRDYYEPIFEVINASEPSDTVQGTQLFHFEAADFTVGLHPMIRDALKSDRPSVLINQFDRRGPSNDIVDQERYGPDGVVVIPGRSWPMGKAIHEGAKRRVRRNLA
jgi:hypothetical protein